MYAFLHYYKLKNYKLSICPHCKKIFFKNSGRQSNNEKYCIRKSPYIEKYFDNNSKGFSHLECGEAVKNINQKLNRKKKRLYSIMYTYNNGNNHYGVANSFLDECLIYRKKIKERASVENLQEYEKFLYTYKKDGENK